MSAYHEDKCSKETLAELKQKVLALLNAHDISLDNLTIKAFPCYGGDVRVYLGIAERISKKESFRRTEPKIKDGQVIGYYGTKGKHQITEREYVAFNEEDFNQDFSMIDYNLDTIRRHLTNKQLEGEN